MRQWLAASLAVNVLLLLAILIVGIDGPRTVSCENGFGEQVTRSIRNDTLFVQRGDRCETPDDIFELTITVVRTIEGAQS